MTFLINFLLVIGFLDSFSKYGDKKPIKRAYKRTYAITMIAFMIILIWFNFIVL